METALSLKEGLGGGPNNPLGSFYNCLQAFPLGRSAAAAPDRTTVGKSTLNSAAVMLCETPRNPLYWLSINEKLGVILLFVFLFIPSTVDTENMFYLKFPLFGYFFNITSMKYRQTTNIFLYT